MKKIWQYILNPFFRSTKSNYMKAMLMSVYHDAALKQKILDFPLDLDWVMLYDRYHPLHLAFQAAYNAWVSSGGTLRGFTLTLKQLFKMIPAKLDLWISMTIPFYVKGTPMYNSMFKNRKPYTKGKTDTKIGAFSSLSTTIGGNVDLHPVQVLVDATYVALDGARVIQSGGKTTKKSGSSAIDVAMNACAVMAYGNLGFLMNKNMATPLMTGPLFDLETLRKSVQSVFTKKMKSIMTWSVVERTLTPTSKLRFKLHGVGILTDHVTLHLASTPDGVDSLPVNALLNVDKVIEASAFGVADYSINKYLVAVTTGNSATIMLLIEFY